MLPAAELVAMVTVRRRPHRRTRRAPRGPGRRPRPPTSSSWSATTTTRTRTSARPTRRWVELVLIGGDVAYGRADWFTTLTEGATGPTVEQLSAWGKPMTLDTGYSTGGAGHGPQPAGTPSLSQLRALLTAAYPPVGPIFA